MAQDRPLDLPSLDACFPTFTIKEILTLVGDYVRVPGPAKRSRRALFECLNAFSEDTKRTIRDAALQTLGTKRKGKNPGGRRKRRRVEAATTDADDMDVDVPVDIVEGPFFEPATEAVQTSCIERAIDQTSNAALTKHICMACARLLFARFVEETTIDRIPNRRHLIPMEPHYAHVLTSGLLLHEEALGLGTTYLCLDRKRRLALDERPPYALANSMWLGKIPFQLKILTLPERILIALYFPAAYVVKLYPKKKNAGGWNKESVNSGLRGNVSTYRLNTAQIVDIVSGELKTMPPSPRILAATIGVTFVGQTNKPLSVLPDFLRVRRIRVFDALMWLKRHNPLYAEIEISQSQLLLLPEDAVPDEILLNTRISSDVGALEREHDGYVPMDIADEQPQEVFESGLNMNTVGAASGVEPVEDDDAQNDESGPGVFHLQTHGVLDVHGEGVPDSDVYAHGYANLAADSSLRAFKVRRDSAFVNEYPRLDALGQRFDGGPGNPNHLLGSFPVLFPYGKGGIEVDRDVDVPYESHVRWALRYADSRFRTDLYFIFQAFGVVQKREVCRSSSLQIKRSSFIANQVAFLKLQPKDLLLASAEETRRVPYSNLVVRKLRKHLTSLRARVPGTDESRIAIRSQIWGMNLRFNPPSIWATINLADTGDPIAQVLAGQSIDLDKFVATAGPSRDKRAVNVASDPFAAAEFFHYTIKMLLEEVFGIRINAKGKFIRQPGVLGEVNGYIGTVEAQGRGTLHLHILFWLAGAPTAAAMHVALQSETFREKIVRYIKQTVRADIKGCDAKQVVEMKKKSSLAYSRPVDPRRPNYELRRHEAEVSLARTAQYHDCDVGRCLVNRGGRLVCKRRAPFTLSSEDWVLPSGEWGPRRVCSRLNSWNPALLQIIRANQDIKLITNGHETKDIAFYITLYIAKKQIQTSNASALLAKSMAFHKKMNERNRNCADVNRRMLQQCANTLSRQQEFSGPEVVSYLMGWGDRFISHKFAPVYWDEIASALRRAFPALERKNVLHRTAVALDEAVPPQAMDVPEEPAVRLQVQDGVFVLKDQLKEYTDRGHELDAMNFYDYHVDTYHGPLLSGRAAEAREDRDESDEEAAAAGVERRRPGRPPSRRVPYLPNSGRKGCRIFRGSTYETVPHFIGNWFPRSDAGEYYFASMLALLKPWRKLSDLLVEAETFETAFATLISGATERMKTVVANVAYFHECSDGSKRRKETVFAPTEGYVDVNDFIRRDQELEEIDGLQVERTEQDVQLARDGRYAYRDYIYAEHAMSIARDAGLFDESPLESSGPHREHASYDDLVKYVEWGKRVALLTRKELLKPANVLNPNVVTDADLNVSVPRPQPAAVLEDTPIPYSRTPKQQAILDMLNSEQRRAHDIIEAHLRRTLAGIPQEQLLMIVRGEGGTGKTVLLNAIADTFEFLRAPEALGKTATTGVAASLVGGQTVHSWAGIKVRGEKKSQDGAIQKPTAATLDKRNRNIIPVKYLDIDECSMLTKTLLAKLSSIIGETLDAAGIADSTRPFGGMNVILFGDFHQFPPVADPQGALYCPTGKKATDQTGLDLYRQFNTVITLTEQKRITDDVWKDLLRRLRRGACTEGDLDALRELLVTESTEDSTHWNEDPWRDAVLVTPRHGVRTRWNTAALLRHCRRTNAQMYICYAEDTVGRGEDTLSLEQRILVAGMTTKQTAKLAETVELAVGMRAMVLTNIATEADLANGTRGEIIDFKLDPREPNETQRDAETGAIILKYPPVVVFFKPDHCTFQPFEGLDPGVLPIIPSKLAFTIETSNGLKHRVHRHQLAMTPAYAFTDYKSQGQTLEYVFIDLERPPQGKLTPFSAYVALSRSRGRDRIRLLRGFDDELFTTHPSDTLAFEDARLDHLTEATRRVAPIHRIVTA